jgi:hypothetical protein
VVKECTMRSTLFFIYWVRTWHDCDCASRIEILGKNLVLIEKNASLTFSDGRKYFDISESNIHTCWTKSKSYSNDISHSPHI